MMRTSIWPCLAYMLIIGVATTYTVADDTDVRVIENPAAVSLDYFGGHQGEAQALAASSYAGGSAIIGTPNNDTGASNSGIAYLFNPTTAGLVATFNNPSPGFADNFGSAVAGVGTDKVIIGAKHDDDALGTGKADAGAAYLFDINNPSAPLATLVTHRGKGANARAGDKFGASVASNGDLIAVGAPFDMNTDKGSVFLFDSAGNKITGGVINNPAAAPNDHFGWDIAMTSTHILVGSPDDDGPVGTGLAGEGVAHLFDTSGNLLQTFNNPNPTNGDKFGFAVGFLENALGGSGPLTAGNDYALVSGNVGGGGRSGNVYIFDMDTGALVRTFTAVGGAMLGVNVAGIPGTNLVISGGPNQDGVAANEGAAWLFHAKSESPIAMYKATNPAHFDYLGSGIAVMDDGVTFLATAENVDYGAGISDAGAVSVFEIPEPTTLTLLALGGLTFLGRRRRA